MPPIDGLADALDAVRSLPPSRCDDAAWSLIDALLDILPRAAAELTLGFRAAGAIDFTQGTVAALEALGDAESPSDLLLKLDLRILHLLVDEFQDTSYAQLELVRRLTAGWQPEDGRTLFAVGDPMQSIYRFRGAEVRLFVDAQAAGCIGDLPVENVVLRRNFRSQAGLVQWANGVFPGVLGPRSDPWRGMVGFVSAVPVRDALPGAAVTVDVLPDPEAEARTIVGHLQAALAAGAQSVAVLVRARAHLAVVLPALRDAGIAFAAVEFDPLAERQAMRDLAALTHALIQPADRLAWLAVLRAPWCGLALPDLVAVAAAADARDDRSVAGLVRATESISSLSQDGRARLARAAPVLAAALDARGRASVAARVRGTWLALGGGATLEDPIDLAAAERFFAVVAAHEVAGDIPDWPALVDALGKLYAEPDHSGSARVQIMTLHRAKGLEFDTVVLAGLARVPNRGGGEVLRWRRRPNGLLLAPMKARGADVDPVYAYLKRLADGEEDAELGRLLYVGCTRAKRQLHLTGVLPSDAAKGGAPVWQMPPAGSALAKFRSVLADVPVPPESASGTTATVSPVRRLARLPLAWMPPVPVASVPVVVSASQRRERPPFDWAHEAARHVGTVAHRLFAQIAREGLSAWDASRIAALAPRVRVELEAEGVDAALLAEAIVAVGTAVERLLADDRGRWLLDARHAEATSEWMLAGWDGDAVAHVAIDRTFVADDVRWIVDFKTSVHEGADIDAFLDREKERYRGQLERYARFVRVLDSRPIRLGLYYPMHGGWREWPYAG